MDLLEQMRTYLRVTETLSLSQAARDLRLSVAAVSRQIAALEDELGVALIARTTRKLAVTETGERWRTHCARVLADVEAARADVAAGPAVRGRVVVSAPASYGLVFLTRRIDRVLAAHPQLSVELRLDDHAVDLVSDGVDLAVRVGMAPPDSNAIFARRLVSFRRVLVATPGYLRKHGTPRHPRDLAGHELLGQSRFAATFVRWQLERDGEQVEVPVVARRTGSSLLAVRDWAEAGVGIGLVPTWLVGSLRVILPAWRTPLLTVHAIHRAELRGSPRIDVVLAALADGMEDDA